MRTAEQRRAHAEERLNREANIWLATASTDGVPHLIPLSLGWDGSRILLATPSDSPTVRNIGASGEVKANLDSADEVVLIDGTATVLDFNAAAEDDIDNYVNRVGWNPGAMDGDWSMVIVTPRTVRVWNGVAEITGRTVMRNGAWVA